MDYDRWLLLILCAALGACGNGNPPPPPGTLQSSSTSRATAQTPTSPDVVQTSSDNAAFAISLYGALRTTSGNLFFSPWSITSALGMTYAGADGQTATEMATALHFSLSGDRLQAALGSIEQDIASDTSQPSQGNPITWREANALFLQQGEVFLSPYLDTLAADYGAGISTLDFENSPDPSRTAINSWIGGVTEGHIANLLAPGSITADTRFVLTNAVYLNAAWEYAFDPSATRPAPFYALDGTQPTVQMMPREASYGFATGTSSASGTAIGWQAVEVPYANRATSFLAIMPDAGSFDAFEAAFDATQLAAVESALHVTTVDLALPRFTMNFSVSLSDVLGQLGMVQAFERDVADFSGMNGGHDLYLSDVVHEAWVDVSESGTEAAAATAVVGATASIVVENPSVTLDHPFLLFIRDVPTGALLFAGRVVDPTASGM